VPLNKITGRAHKSKKAACEDAKRDMRRQKGRIKKKEMCAKRKIIETKANKINFVEM